MVKQLARRKKDSGGGGGNAPWLNTFADLMNLLLCFFVLLFSMSTVSEQKFEDVSISFANALGVFEGGGSSITGEGRMISAGISQLNELDVFLNSMGETTKGSNTSKNNTNSSNNGANNSSGSQEVLDMEANEEGVQEGAMGSDSPLENDKNSLQKALSVLQSAMQEETREMYDKASDLTEKYNIKDDATLSLDSNYQYVQLTLKGSVFFDSGSAEIKKEAYRILNNLGKILENFKGHHVEIIGHTDNVPITSSVYRDNNWLSSARALNAADYLIEKCGVDPDYLKYSGRGEYDPIASNSTAEGRGRNRRIEIKIYNSYYNN